VPINVRIGNNTALKKPKITKRQLTMGIIDNLHDFFIHNYDVQNDDMTIIKNYFKDAVNNAIRELPAVHEDPLPLMDDDVNAYPSRLSINVSNFEKSSVEYLFKNSLPAQIDLSGDKLLSLLNTNNEVDDDIKKQIALSHRISFDYVQNSENPEQQAQQAQIIGNFLLKYYNGITDKDDLFNSKNDATGLIHFCSDAALNGTIFQILNETNKAVRLITPAECFDSALNLTAGFKSNPSVYCFPPPIMTSISAPFPTNNMQIMLRNDEFSAKKPSSFFIDIVDISNAGAPNIVETIRFHTHISGPSINTLIEEMRGTHDASSNKHMCRILTPIKSKDERLFSKMVEQGVGFSIKQEGDYAQINHLKTIMEQKINKIETGVLVTFDILSQNAASGEFGVSTLRVTNQKQHTTMNAWRCSPSIDENILVAKNDYTIIYNEINEIIADYSNKLRIIENIITSLTEQVAQLNAASSNDVDFGLTTSFRNNHAKYHLKLTIIEWLSQAINDIENARVTEDNPLSSYPMPDVLSDLDVIQKNKTELIKIKDGLIQRIREIPFQLMRTIDASSPPTIVVFDSSANKILNAPMIGFRVNNYKKLYDCIISLYAFCKLKLNRDYEGRNDATVFATRMKDLEDVINDIGVRDSKIAQILLIPSSQRRSLNEVYAEIISFVENQERESEQTHGGSKIKQTGGSKKMSSFDANTIVNLLSHAVLFGFRSFDTDEDKMHELIDYHIETLLAEMEMCVHPSTGTIVDIISVLNASASGPELIESEVNDLIKDLYLWKTDLPAYTDAIAALLYINVFRDDNKISSSSHVETFDDVNDFIEKLKRYFDMSKLKDDDHDWIKRYKTARDAQQPMVLSPRKTLVDLLKDVGISPVSFVGTPKGLSEKSTAALKRGPPSRSESPQPPPRILRRSSSRSLDFGNMGDEGDEGHEGDDDVEPTTFSRTASSFTEPDPSYDSEATMSPPPASSSSEGEGDDTYNGVIITLITSLNNKYHFFMDDSTHALFKISNNTRDALSELYNARQIGKLEGGKVMFLNKDDQYVEFTIQNNIINQPPESELSTFRFHDDKTGGGNQQQLIKKFNKMTLKQRLSRKHKYTRSRHNKRPMITTRRQKYLLQKAARLHTRKYKLSGS
jgi:hypothetical protein